MSDTINDDLLAADAIPSEDAEELDSAITLLKREILAAIKQLKSAQSELLGTMRTQLAGDETLS